MITFQPERSTSRAAGQDSTMCRMVGTQCEKVTFSVSISARIVSAA